MADGFDPLDVNGLIRPPQPPMQQPQKMNPLLMAILPIAMAKGGREAVTGLLQGFSGAQQQQAVNQRADAGVQLQREQFDALERHRRETEEATKRGQRQTFMDKFQTRLGDVETDDEVRGLLEAFGVAGQDLGIERGALDKIAIQTATPTKIQKRAAERRVKALKDQFGVKWLEEGAKFLHDMPGGERIGIQDLLMRAGMAPDPNAPKAPTSEVALDIPLDRQHAAALASGNTQLSAQIEEAIRRQDAARRDPKAPPDPVLNEIRQLRLEQMRNTPTPALPPATQRRVDSKARTFESLPIVKTAQKQAEAVSFADSLNPNTKNPADDQALIYAFAKAMDPDSVVREGEYATVQKYAQSWMESFGFNAVRVLSNSEFLTPQARQNMKATIRKRYLAGKSQYDNVRKSYVSQINKITGQGDGEEYLTDYGAAFPADQQGGNDPEEGQERPIPGIRGGVARKQGGKWIRVK